MKHRVTLPDGSVVVRKSASKTYTHVVAVLGFDGRWGIRNWCGRHDLAIKEAAAAREPSKPGREPKNYTEVKICEVVSS